MAGSSTGSAVPVVGGGCALDAADVGTEVNSGGGLAIPIATSSLRCVWDRGFSQSDR